MNFIIPTAAAFPECDIGFSDFISSMLHPNFYTFRIVFIGFISYFALIFLITWVVRLFIGQGIRDYKLISKIAVIVSIILAFITFVARSIPYCI